MVNWRGVEHQRKMPSLAWHFSLVQKVAIVIRLLYSNVKKSKKDLPLQIIKF
jgi:hypothetical protein